MTMKLIFQMACTGGSRLSPDFLGALKSVWLNHYPAYPIIIISLIIQRNLATKIQDKWESGLTAVWLKWDSPVYCIQNAISSLDTSGVNYLWRW